METAGHRQSIAAVSPCIMMPRRLSMPPWAPKPFRKCPATRIHEIVKERPGVTADTAERFARYIAGDATSWFAMHADFDLKTLPTRMDIARKLLPGEPMSV